MSFNDFMAKVRQWDNNSQQWIMRHFYVMFFQFILVAIFVAVFVNALKIIDINLDIHKPSHESTIIERLLMTQSFNTLIITILLIFNSFWMLYIFGSLLRLRTILRNIDFNLSRRRSDHRNRDRDN